MTGNAGVGPAGDLVQLRRTLGLWHVVLYGLGVTVGAGIYVLVGAAAARAGMHAPVAFLAAALVMALTGFSLAELASRMPVASGEAAYVRAGFGSDAMGLVVGLTVIVIAVVSAAAISVGSAGYLGVFVPWPRPVLVVMVVLAMGAIAIVGIRESVTFAAAMTLIEIGGLVVLVAAGMLAEGDLVTRLPEAIPAPGDGAAWSGILAAGLLAVFAFVGFEGIVNIAEEVEDPARTIPRAILITLGLATALYIAVVWVALVAVGPTDLAASSAPLALVFERLTGASPRLMAAVAVVATLNGVIVQMIMGSRVTYGLAMQNALPTGLGVIHPTTRTPVRATLAVTAATLALALLVPLGQLADLTARLALVLFVLVNLALVLVKRRDIASPAGIFVVPFWVPAMATVSTLVLLVSDLAW